MKNTEMVKKLAPAEKKEFNRFHEVILSSACDTAASVRKEAEIPNGLEFRVIIDNGHASVWLRKSDWKNYLKLNQPEKKRHFFRNHLWFIAPAIFFSLVIGSLAATLSAPGSMWLSYFVPGRIHAFFMSFSLPMAVASVILLIFFLAGDEESRTENYPAHSAQENYHAHSAHSN